MHAALSVTEHLAQRQEKKLKHSFKSPESQESNGIEIEALFAESHYSQSKVKTTSKTILKLCIL